jgi:hypothetical protein
VFDFQQDPASFLNQGRMATYVGANAVTFKGPAVRVAVSDPAAQTLGTIWAKSVPDAPQMPGVVSHTFGKGRVVYLAAGFDAAYYLYAYPYQRLILKQSIEWAASAPPPVTIEAPMCVQSTVMRQTTESGERLVVHLFNDLNTTAHHALPVDDVPLREETVPIHDIRVTFRGVSRPRHVHLEPGGLACDLSAETDGVSVVVPRLDVHSMVVAELESTVSP